MPSYAEIEKVRQEIMRFRELLNIMHEKLDEGDRAYTRLFSACSDEDKKTLKEKDLQWKLAQALVTDLAPLSKAVMQSQYNARELERAFEELYDIIATVEEEP